jgi:hypothetical protein
MVATSGYIFVKLTNIKYPKIYMYYTYTNNTSFFGFESMFQMFLFSECAIFKTKNEIIAHEMCKSNVSSAE